MRIHDSRANLSGVLTSDVKVDIVSGQHALSLVLACADGSEDRGGGLAVASMTTSAASMGPTDAALSSSASQRTRVPATPRLRTRLFAARCLLDIPGAVGEDPRHFDAALLAHKASGTAAAAPSEDWLVLELAQFIDIGFKMATGQVEALRVLGLRLLKVQCLLRAMCKLVHGSHIGSCFLICVI